MNTNIKMNKKSKIKKQIFMKLKKEKKEKELFLVCYKNFK